MFLDIFCALYSFISLGLIKPKEFFLKKCYLPDDFDLFFLVILSIATSGSNSIGPKKIQTSIVQVKRSFLQQLSESWKEMFSEKNTFPVKKNTYSFFLLIPRFADVHNKFITLHKYSSEIGASKKVNSQRPDKQLKTK